MFFTFFFLNTYEKPGFEKGSWESPYKIYSHLFLIVILNFLIIRRGGTRIKKLFSFNFFILYFIFMLLAGVNSMFWSEFSTGGIQFSILLFLQLVFAHLILYPNPIVKIINLLEIYSNVALVLASVAILRIFYDLSIFDLELSQIEPGRLSGWMRSANYFSIFIGIALLFEWFKFQINEKKTNFGLIKVFLFIVTIILSGSRGALLSLTIILIILTFFSFSKMRLKDFVKSYCWIIIPIIFGSLFLNVILESLGYSYSFFDESVLRSDENITEDERSNIWEHTILNWSTGDFFDKFFGFGREMSTELAGRSTHNSYITLLVEYGITYVVFYLFLIFKLFKKLGALIKHDNTFLMLFSILLYLFLRSLTNNVLGGFGINQILFNLIIIVTLAGYANRKNTLHS
jgi:hypothetical protein